MGPVSVGLLEDDQPQGEMVGSWLRAEGYACQHFTRGLACLEGLREQPLDMLIIDWQLPDQSGLEVMRDARTVLGFSGPIIFTTARASEEDIVQALSSGADDYLIKPLRQKELLARLSALWRRAGNHSAESLQLGPISLDLVNQQAWLDGEVIKLTPTEFSLAACMISRVGELLSREFLLREVWGVNACIDTRTVDMHVCRLRKLLKIGPEAGLCINTVYRHGYRLEQL